MRFKMVLFTIGLFFLNGCAMGQYAVITSINPIKKDINTFNAGMEQKANVGDIMVAKGTLSMFPKFISVLDYTPPKYPVGFSFPTIPNNTTWQCKNQIDKGFVCMMPGWFASDMTGTTTIKDSGVVLSEEGFLLGGVYGINHEAYPQFFEFKGEGITPPPQNMFSRTENGLFENTENFKMELIYNGKSQNVIRINYREFTENFAKPAFYQDLTYDLSESKEISFRDIKIEVIEATNNYIKFVVK